MWKPEALPQNPQIIVGPRPIGPSGPVNFERKEHSLAIPHSGLPIPTDKPGLNGPLK